MECYVSFALQEIVMDKLIYVINDVLFAPQNRFCSRSQLPQNAEKTSVHLTHISLAHEIIRGNLYFSLSSLMITSCIVVIIQRNVSPYKMTMRHRLNRIERNENEHVMKFLFDLVDDI